MSDFYSLLGVERGATDDDIKKAYRKQAMELHPDRNSAHDAESRFKEVTEAYEVLRDPQKRAAYDRYGKAGLRSGWRRVRVPPRGPDRGAQHLHARLRRPRRVRVALRRRWRRAAAEARRGQDIRVTVKMTLAEVATGVEADHQAQDPRCLRALRGHRRAEAGPTPAACSTCGGAGEVRRAARSVFGQFVQVAACPTCGGEGTVIRTPCEVCRGEGRIRAERTVQAEIPAGVSTNNYLTMRGQGAAGPRNGGRATSSS